MTGNGLPLTRNVVVDLTGVRHHVAAATTDPRVVITACGIRVALLGHGHPRPTPCLRECGASGTA